MGRIDAPPPPRQAPRASATAWKIASGVLAAGVIALGFYELGSRRLQRTNASEPVAPQAALARSTPEATEAPAVNSRPPAEKVWAQEPTAFKGIPFGATEQEIQRAISERLPVGSESGFRCADVRREGIKLRACWVGRSDALGDKYILYAGKLVHVDFGFAADDYPKMREAFIAKYGPPHKVDTSVLQNRMGAQFAQETLFWEGQHIQVFLSHYGSNVTEGTAFISTLDFGKRVQQATEEEKRKLKDSL